ncbi:unnamed protein product, partial [Ectocarpus fasciculatus]
QTGASRVVLFKPKCVACLLSLLLRALPLNYKAWPPTLPSKRCQSVTLAADTGAPFFTCVTPQALRQEQPPPLPDGDLGGDNGRRCAGSRPATPENLRAALRLGSSHCRRRRCSATAAAANHSSSSGFLLFRGDDHRALSSGCIIILERCRVLLRNGGTSRGGSRTSADSIGRFARFFSPPPFRHYCCRRISRHTAYFRLRSGGGRGRRRRGHHWLPLYRCRPRRGEGLRVRMHDRRRRRPCAHLRLPTAPAPAAEAIRSVNPVLGGKRPHSRDGGERREAFARAGRA